MGIKIISTYMKKTTTTNLQ